MTSQVLLEKLIQLYQNCEKLGKFSEIGVLKIKINILKIEEIYAEYYLVIRSANSPTYVHYIFWVLAKRLFY